jgi:hypothetical protein
MIRGQKANNWGVRNYERDWRTYCHRNPLSSIAASLLLTQLSLVSWPETLERAWPQLWILAHQVQMMILHLTIPVSSELRAHSSRVSGQKISQLTS